MNFQIAEFSLSRPRDTGWSSQRARLLGSLAGLPLKRSTSFGKAVEHIIAPIINRGCVGTLQLGLIDLNGLHVEAIIRGADPTILDSVAQLVDRMDTDTSEDGIVVHLAQKLPDNAPDITPETASEWATPLAMRTTRDALTTSQRRVGELANNLRNAEERGLNLERELSHLKSLNDTLELLALVASKTENAVIILNDQLKIEWVNDGFVRMTGYETNEVIKEPIQRVLYDDSHSGEAIHELETSCAEGHGVSQEILHHRKDGRTYWASITVSPVFSDGGTITRWICIANDATKRRHAQEALQRAKDEAELASRAKSEFLANMSHEIRTPMNAIIGMSALTLETDLNDEQCEYLMTIQDSAEGLLSLLNDILDLSKIEARKLQIDKIEFALSETLRDALKPFAYQAHQQGIRLDLNLPLNIPERFHGDPARIRQIITNLVGNAIKFTTEGEISVSVRLKEHTSTRTTLCFSVRDTGIGIASDKLNQIFEAFTQADSSTSRRFGGTGLGLAISTQLVELMGGRIWVESEEGKGSTFHFEIGLEVSDEPEAKPSATEGGQPAFAPDVQSSTRNLNILIADDNRANRRLARKILEKRSHIVCEAEDGKEVLAKIKTQPFEVILLDVQMPELDGLETANMIRQSENKLAIQPYIIALTAHAMEGDRERCLAAGMDAYIAKPLRAAQLLALIDAVSVPPSDVTQESPTFVSGPFDFSNALNRLEGDHDLLREQMQFYLEDSPILIRDIDLSIEENDGNKLCMAAHRLRGLSAGFDVIDLVAIAANLEELGRQAKPELGEALRSALNFHWNELCAAIRQFLKL